MSHLEDLSRLRVLRLAPMTAVDSAAAEYNTGNGMMQRVDRIASHMVKQLREYEEAQANTNRLFQQMLTELDEVCDCFRNAFFDRSVSSLQVFSQVDADRSVGILNILWHTISFTTRGNTKPLALQRPGRDPIFTGRIIALRGDFQELARELPDQEYPDLLEYEMASLYIPADITAPAVMRVRHLGDEEQYIHQADAARFFLMKTIEMLCGGGIFHERL